MKLLRANAVVMFQLKDLAVKNNFFFKRCVFFVGEKSQTGELSTFDQCEENMNSI